MNEKGQALFEYILLAVVVVMLILGISLAFFRPLGTFIAELNGNYIKCLLETGELPKIGADGQGICDDVIPRFTMRNTDGSAITPEQQQRRLEENQQAQRNVDPDGGGSNSGGGASGGRARLAQSSMLRNAARAGRNGRGEGRNDKTVSLPVDGVSAGEGFMNYGSSGGPVANRRKTRKVALDGLTEYDRKKIEKAGQEKTIPVTMDAESFTQKPPKKLIVKPPPPKEKEENLNVGTDFGKYFKILFLVVIVLFIVILMGSQALQMTNSDN